MRARIAVEAITEVTAGMTLIILKMNTHTVFASLMRAYPTVPDWASFDAAWVQT
jgi:hypothetical protein